MSSIQPEKKSSNLKTQGGNQLGNMKPKGKLLPIFKRLLRYIVKYKKSMAFIVLGFLFSSALSLTPALIVKTALDQYLMPDRVGYLIAAGSGILLAALAQAAIDFATRYYSEVNGQKAVLSLRRQVYSHLMDLSFTYYDKARTGDILSRLTSDTETLQTFLGFASVTILSNLLFILGVFFVMMVWSIPLSLLYLVFVPFMVFGIARYAFGLRPATGRLRMVLGKLGNTVQEQIRGIQLVKTFGREKHAAAACGKINRQYMQTGIQAGRIVSFWMFLLSDLRSSSAIDARIVRSSSPSALSVSILCSSNRTPPPRERSSRTERSSSSVFRAKRETDFVRMTSTSPTRDASIMAMNPGRSSRLPEIPASE